MARPLVGVCSLCPWVLRHSRLDDRNVYYSEIHSDPPELIKKELISGSGRFVDRTCRSCVKWSCLASRLSPSTSGCRQICSSLACSGICCCSSLITTSLWKKAESRSPTNPISRLVNDCHCYCYHCTLVLFMHHRYFYLFIVLSAHPSFTFTILSFSLRDRNVILLVKIPALEIP